jgi:hypothetical protein
MSALKPSPTSEALRIESEPPGAEAKTSQGQSCRTPCQVVVQTGNEISVARSQRVEPQTVSVRPEAPPPGRSRPAQARVAAVAQPDLHRAAAGTGPPAAKAAVKKRSRRSQQPSLRTSADHDRLRAFGCSGADAGGPPEPAASATNYPWPTDNGVCGG